MATHNIPSSLICRKNGLITLPAAVGDGAAVGRRAHRAARFFFVRAVAKLAASGRVGDVAKTTGNLIFIKMPEAEFARAGRIDQLSAFRQEMHA